uniref:alpha/beta hydrolase family protein n=1 Tax=uncultured Draconibacterium sp. TaxID=1573823 RepID=UPI0032173F4D
MGRMHKYIFSIVVFGIILLLNEQVKAFPGKPIEEISKTEKTPENGWSEEFDVVEIASHPDGYVHKAYFYPSRSETPKPLVVSLHTWSGDYRQSDPIANLSLAKDLNYIHPDFRGPNRTKNACCSCLALQDIDEAITYAIENGNVDKDEIYVIGESGGGYATLSCFMKSKHAIKKFSAWVPISNLVAWYNENIIRNESYADDILGCTQSENEILNERVAREKSPLFWETPVEKLANTELHIHAGVYDGLQGSVPITHSINFYNKVLSDLGVQDASKYVSDKEKLHLLEHRSALGEFGMIGDREVFLQKEHGNLKLIIFKGRHEMLSEYAFNKLLED